MENTRRDFLRLAALAAAAGQPEARGRRCLEHQPAGRVPFLVNQNGSIPCSFVADHQREFPTQQEMLQAIE